MIINRLEFLERADIDPQTLEIWISEEWLLPNRLLTDLEFSEVDLARATFIRDLRDRMGINDEGIGAVLNLVDQIHGLRRLLRVLIPEEPGQPSTLRIATRDTIGDQ